MAILIFYQLVPNCADFLSRSLPLAEFYIVQWLVARFLPPILHWLLTFAPRKTCVWHAATSRFFAINVTTVVIINDIKEKCKRFFIFFSLAFSHIFIWFLRMYCANWQWMFHIDAKWISHILKFNKTSKKMPLQSFFSYVIITIDKRNEYIHIHTNRKPTS